jgi:hypothetical protein
MFAKLMLCVSRGGEAGDGREAQHLIVRRWIIHGQRGNDDASSNRYQR